MSFTKKHSSFLSLWKGKRQSNMNRSKPMADRNQESSSIGLRKMAGSLRHCYIKNIIWMNQGNESCIYTFIIELVLPYSWLMRLILSSEDWTFVRCTSTRLLQYPSFINKASLVSKWYRILKKKALRKLSINNKSVFWKGLIKRKNFLLL